MNKESQEISEGIVTLKNSEMEVYPVTMKEMLDFESSQISAVLEKSLSVSEFSFGRTLIAENPESYYFFIKEQSFTNLLAKFHPYLSFVRTGDSSSYLPREMKFYRHISSDPLRTMQDYYSGMADSINKSCLEIYGKNSLQEKSKNILRKG